LRRAHDPVTENTQREQRQPHQAQQDRKEEIDHPDQERQQTSQFFLTANALATSGRITTSSMPAG